MWYVLSIGLPQPAGVTMGINCAPLIVDLFLYSYEDQWMANLLKGPSKHSMLGLFNNNSRYLDDILTVNDLNFLTFVKQI